MHHTLWSIDERSEVATSLQLFIECLHVTFECLTVSFASHHFYVDVFDVARFTFETEEIFASLVGSLQIFVSHFNFLVGNGAIRECSHFSTRSHRSSIILHLCSYGVWSERCHEERLVLVHQQFLTQLLLSVCPELVDHCHLLCHFRIRLLALHRLSLLQKLLQSSVVETSSLSHEHWHILESLSSTFFNRLLHFLVCYFKTELISFVLHELELDILLPNHITHLILLLIGEVTTRAKFCCLASFIDHFIEVLLRKAFAIHRTSVVAGISQHRQGVLVEHHGEDEKKHAHTHETNDPWTASDFL